MKLLILHERNRQKGTALVIAIGLLAVLSILGTVVLTSSTRDMGLSGGILPARQAFYTSDRAVEYAMNRDIIVNLSPGTTLDLVGVNAKDADNNDLSPAVTHDEIIEGTSGGELLSGTVEDLGPRDLPPAMASIHGSDFGANLYHVKVKSASSGGANAKESRIDASIVRLYKIDDDTIFRIAE